ncbi:hypothetical protein ACOZ4N_09550 [Halorientalis pallida]|uniref:hypothetical protein n=1 Tax=Halorientalis pallida TaxID=2479928 RepID=UPI003C6F2A91
MSDQTDDALKRVRETFATAAEEAEQLSESAKQDVEDAIDDLEARIEDLRNSS